MKGTMKLNPERMKELRLENMWTVKDFAAIAGVSHRSVTAAETHGEISPKIARKLVDALGVKPTEVLPGKADASRQAGHSVDEAPVSLDARRLVDPEVQRMALADLSSYDDATFATVAAGIEAAIEAERIRRERSA